MFNLKFGIFWTLFIAIFTWGMFYTDGYIELEPLLFLSVFWIIGISFIVSGIKIVYRDKQTELNGDFCYGRLIDIMPTGSYVNDVPELKADFLVVVPGSGEIRLMTEIIGFANKVFYDIGDYFELKIFIDDINIVSQIQKEHVTNSDLETLQLESIRYGVREKMPTINRDSIYIDGVEYVKK